MTYRANESCPGNIARESDNNRFGETDPMVLKFVGVNLPIKGGSVVIEQVYGETLWVTKYNKQGRIVAEDVEINQAKILPIVEQTNKTKLDQDSKETIIKERISYNAKVPIPRAKKLTMHSHYNRNK